MAEHEPRPEHQLLVLTDETGHRMADKLFQAYVVGDAEKGKGDMRRKAEFVIALDRLLSEFGGQPIPDKEGNQERRGFNGDRDYDDEEDIHEMATVNGVKAIIAKLLR
jgi:hypothetical protein